MTLAAACAALGTGCRETAVPDGRTCLEFWVAPVGADGALARLRTVLAPIARAEFGRADEDPGWQTAMREFHQPVDVAGRIRVRPPWHAPSGEAVDVVIDPAMAFGTGPARHHARLSRTAHRGRAGAPRRHRLRLGRARASRRPSSGSRRSGPGTVTRWRSRRRSPTPARTGSPWRSACAMRSRRALPAAEVVLANLTATILIALAPRLAGSAARAAILSGMRPDELAPVCRAWAPTGLVPADRRVGPDWASVLLTRP